MSTAPFIDWAVASRPFVGESQSGDLHVVEPFRDGVLLGAIDGLGHGAKAAAAALEALEVLRELPGAPVEELFLRCSRRLKHSRGVVMTLASLHADEGVMSWAGIGNVEAVLWRPPDSRHSRRESLPLRGGFIGDGVATTHARTVPLERGDVALFATDGLRAGFGDRLDLDANLETQTEALFQRYAKEEDDALLLLARWKGESP